MAEAPLKVFHVELDGVDELSAGVFRAFLGALRLHRRLMFETLGDRGAHPGQAICLRMVCANDGITQRDLTEALQLSRPTVSRMLQAMEKAGTVERRADETDQRLTRVHMTAAGRELERRLRDVSAAYVNETIGALPEADRRELERLLLDLGASISRAIEARGGGAAADAAAREPRA